MSRHNSTVDPDTLRELALENLQHAGTPKLGYGFELQRREFFKLLGGGLAFSGIVGSRRWCR